MKKKLNFEITRIDSCNSYIIKRMHLEKINLESMHNIDVDEFNWKQKLFLRKMLQISNVTYDVNLTMLTLHCLLIIGGKDN